MEQQITKINQLKRDSKAELDLLIKRQDKIKKKIAKLGKIINECEATIILFGKYDSITNTSSDISLLIAEDNLRLMENFDEKYAELIQDSIFETKEQIKNAGIELLKKEEATGVKERTVNEIATLLRGEDNEELATKIEKLAIDGKVVEKL
jgi:hypothetical protein